MRLTRSLYLAALITVLLAALVLPASAQTTRVSIDTTRARKPISKYIYGQFMEHYGRSIYGGTWSEMLEDRKFFYTVTGESPAWTMFQPGPGTHEGEGHPYELLTRSPWMIIGEKGAVTMMAGNSTRASVLSRKFALLIRDGFSSPVRRATQDQAAESLLTTIRRFALRAFQRS